ncbi:hypothetical protein Vi05172_g5871 [Venturia inaequalis]|nr:hypothetical protein Vi05172_g5871 [Venturia inaequalis]
MPQVASTSVFGMRNMYSVQKQALGVKFNRAPEEGLTMGDGYSTQPRLAFTSLHVTVSNQACLKHASISVRAS